MTTATATQTEPETAPAKTRRTIDHVVGAINASATSVEPFHHLQLKGIFPADVYAEILEAMPVKADYRQMSGRTKSTRTDDGSGTRTKIDLFPEYIRHLPPAKKQVWEVVGTALRSAPVREAFRNLLAPGLEQRFGADYKTVGMYPIPILTRDVPGYSIGIHPDTRSKGMTIQLYLPADESIAHTGTAFHRRTGEHTYEKTRSMSFSPNTGYAFAVGQDTYHSVDTLGPEVQTRDSILLTYFVDETPLQVARNRFKRAGNFVLNEARNLQR